jgi:hypothetical protein
MMIAIESIYWSLMLKELDYVLGILST